MASYVSESLGEDAWRCVYKISSSLSTAKAPRNIADTSRGRCIIGRRERVLWAATELDELRFYAALS